MSYFRDWEGFEGIKDAATFHCRERFQLRQSPRDYFEPLLFVLGFRCVAARLFRFALVFRSCRKIYPNNSDIPLLSGQWRDVWNINDNQVAIRVPSLMTRAQIRGPLLNILIRAITISNVFGFVQVSVKIDQSFVQWTTRLQLNLCTDVQLQQGQSCDRQSKNY